MMDKQWIQLMRNQYLWKYGTGKRQLSGIKVTDCLVYLSLTILEVTQDIESNAWLVDSKEQSLP